jgi:hypothetical protein
MLGVDCWWEKVEGRCRDEVYGKDVVTYLCLGLVVSCRGDEVAVSNRLVWVDGEWLM